MQTVYVGARRDSGPILNVLLVLVILTSLVGAVCIGIGAEIGNNFDNVSNVGSSFWWGGVALVILGVLYVPCHFLVKKSEGAGRVLFLFWTFCVGIGVLVILASAVITLVLYLIIEVYNIDYCLYYADSSKPPSPPSNLCKQQCDAGLQTKIGYSYSRVCCCCDISYRGSTYDIAYAEGVGSCSVFTDNFGLTKALLALYSVSLILIFMDMTIAYIISCGCCSVQTPWFQPITTTTTTTTFVTGQQRASSYNSTVLPPKSDYA